MLPCPIAFHANCDTILLDSMLRTSYEETFPTVYVEISTKKFYFHELFLAVPFPACSQNKFWEHLGKRAVPMRKARLVGLLLALTRQAASVVLELSSPTLTSWRSLCWQPDWDPCWLDTRALAPWDRSWSLQGHGPNSAASSTLGFLKRIFCHQW